MKTLALILLALAVLALLRNLAGENVDCSSPQYLRPVSAWPWGTCKKESK